jgi:phage gpG-like protein
MTTAEVTWNGDEFLQDLKEAQFNGLDRMGNVLAKSVRKSLNQKNSSRTARKRAKKKGGDMGMYGASAPGEPPARMTGALWRSINHAIVQDENSVIVGVESDSTANTYALIHEFGGFIENKGGAAYIQLASGRTTFLRRSSSVTPGKKTRQQKGVGAIKKAFKAGAQVQFTAGSRTEMPARPYLRPALAREVANLNEAFTKETARTLKQKGWI